MKASLHPDEDVIFPCGVSVASKSSENDVTVPVVTPASTSTYGGVLMMRSKPYGTEHISSPSGKPPRCGIIRFNRYTFLCQP